MALDGAVIFRGEVRQAPGSVPGELRQRSALCLVFDAAVLPVCVCWAC